MASYKVGDRAEVLMEAVAQDCHEEDIKPEERNINNKGKKKQWIYTVDFKVIDEKPGPLAKDEVHRLVFKPLDPMDRYKPGTKWRVPLWKLAEDPHRILHVHSRKSDKDEWTRTDWQLMAVIMRGDRPPMEPDADKVRVVSSTE